MRPWLVKAKERYFREVFKRFSVQILRLMLPFWRLPWDLLLRFYIPKQKKNIKIWHFRNVAFMVYIIIKA